jgi:hypothetical protein
MSIAASADGRYTVSVEALLPSMTYIFRLWVVGSDGQLLGPGTDIAFDTEGQYIANGQSACENVSGFSMQQFIMQPFAHLRICVYALRAPGISHSRVVHSEAELLRCLMTSTLD